MSKFKYFLTLPTLCMALLWLLNALFPLPDPYGKKGFARVVLDSEGRPLRYFADNNGEWRYYVSVDEVSEIYLQALIGYEDRYFYKHSGVNPLSIARAFFQYVKHGKIVSGGSTISMQVARITDPHSRTILGKIKQILRTAQLEHKYSKDEILEMYLNFAPFGGNIQGVQAASYTYFNRSVSEINYSEAALLVVLPQAPSRLRPDRHYSAAQNAKNKVAKRMFEYGIWSEKTVKDVLSEDIFLVETPKPLLAALLTERLIREHPESKVIHSYIDRELQIYIEALLEREKYSLPAGTSAAAMVVNNNNHEVIAYAGSIEYGNIAAGGFIDMVSSIRSPGSTLKPFIYALGLEEGYIHSKSMLIDAPRIFSTYKAGNFYQNFSGPVNATEALQKSLNVPAVQLLEHVDPAYFYSAMRNAGLRLPILGGRPNLSIALGGGGVRLDELTMIYTAFANKGVVYKPVYSTLEEPSQPRYLISEEAAYIVYEILRSQQRYDHIFHRITGKENKLAWKTGTSYGFRDALAVGTTKNYTIGIWVGRPDNTPVTGITGTKNATPLLFSISDYLQTKINVSDVEQPETVQEVTICWPSGLSEVLVEKKYCQQRLTALTIEGATPATLPETPADTAQSYLLRWMETPKGYRADRSCKLDEGELLLQKSAHVWPRLTEAWIPRQYRRSAILPPWDSSCAENNILSKGQLIITSITNGSTIKAASTSGGMPSISLNSAGGTGKISWYLNGELVSQGTSAATYSIPKTGQYQLTAVDEELQLDVVTFYVD